MIDKPVLGNIGVAGFLISIPFAGNIAAPTARTQCGSSPSRLRGSFRQDSLCDIISARSLAPFHSSKRERY